MSLADIFGRIESSSTTAAPNNDAISSTGARGFLQQFPAFQRQFAGNAGPVSTDPQVQVAGLNNFAAQAIRNNPGITFGDLYAEYNRGTGNPGSGATFADLTPQQQQQVRATGVNPNTPAISIVNSSPGNESVAVPGGVAVSDITVGQDPTTAPGGDLNPGEAGALGDPTGAPSAGAVAGAGSAIGAGAGAGLSYVADAAKAATSIPAAIVSAGTAVTDGLTGVGKTIGGYASGAIAAAESIFLRGGVMLLATIMLLGAIWLMIPRDTKTKIASTGLGMGGRRPPSGGGSKPARVGYHADGTAAAQYHLNGKPANAAARAQGRYLGPKVT